MSKRLLVVAPGRGSYTRESLGSLKRFEAFEWSRAILDQADALRREANQMTIRELDGADKFGARPHSLGENASALIFTASVLDFEELRRHPRGYELVACTGNSMGWYTALYCAGVLSLEDAFRVVNGMGSRQQGRVIGGQLITPVVDSQWRYDPALDAQLQKTLSEIQSQSTNFALSVSIALGGFRVIAGTAEALKNLEQRLPPVQLGRNSYPLRLAFHSAFHSPLLKEASDFGRELAPSLGWQSRFQRPLIDGRGHCWSQYGSARRQALIDYTFGEQVLSLYNFSAAVRVGLLEWRPDHVVLLGPGAGLGSSIAQVMIAENWQGMNDREDFLAAQSSAMPLISLGRSDQRTALLGD